jgi:hypothetical protein
MSTIYTVNGKVLKNADNGKWLTKKEAPAGFVMNASNATITNTGSTIYVSWQSPAYPNAYNGGGKHYTLVNTNETAPQSSSQLMYGNAVAGAGPSAISGSDMAVLGTSNGTLLNDSVPLEVGYGTHLVWPQPVSGWTDEQIRAYIANVTITIVDP